MLTRKDFKAIAGILKNERTAATSQDGLGRIDGICLEIADYLATKNPAFDRDKFLTACGIK